MFTYYRFSKGRIALALACFLGVIFLPWWVPMLLALILSLRYRAWEIILIGMFADLYWMSGFIAPSLDSLPLATLYSIIILFIFEPLRRQLLVGPEIL